MATEQRTIQGGNHLFYILGAVAVAVTVLVGFAKTYYLKTVFGTPSLTPLLHLHGLVMTLYVAIFIVQTWLVASHRTRIHRRLGVFGALLAAVVLVVGTTTIIVGTKLGHFPSPPPFRVPAIPLGELVVFGTLVTIGLYYRSKREIHRRLMLLSIFSLLPPAVGRIPMTFIENHDLLMPAMLPDLIMLAFVAYDTLKFRRLHPAFAWGGLLIIATRPLCLMIGNTDAWLQFASWLVR